MARCHPKSRFDPGTAGLRVRDAMKNCLSGGQINKSWCKWMRQASLLLTQLVTPKSRH